MKKQIDWTLVGARWSTLPLCVMSFTIACLAGCASQTAVTGSAAQMVTNKQLGLTEPGPPIAPDWWQQLGDMQLNALMAQALEANPSLRVAQARIRRASASREGVAAADLPQATLDMEVTHQRFSKNSIYPPPFGGAIDDSGNLQLGANWELDFFGKNRTALHAALSQEQVARAEVAAAQNLLTTQVARQYVQLLRLREQKLLAQRSLTQRTKALELVLERVKAGLDTQLELQQSDGALPEARLQIEQISEQEQLTLNALAALIAKPVESIAISAKDLGALTNIELAQTIPMNLLGLRADIAAAKARVEATASEVENAQTLFYPNISLNGFAGFSSIGLEQLLQGSSLQWGVGPALHLPLFNGGRLRANLRGKNADLDAAIESYNTQVLEAVHEVSDQLASSRAVARQTLQAKASLSFAESAYGIAVQRYQAGLGTYLNVLGAESNVLTQRRQNVDLHARTLELQIQLIHALGGGVLNPEPAGPGAS